MGITTADEMLQAQAHVFHHVMGHLGSMSLKCALQLEIPDLIQAHGRPMTVSDLLSKLPVSPVKAHCLGRIMRLLAQMGYFKLVVEEEGDEAYSVTPLSEILLKDSPMSLRPWVLGTLSPHITAIGHHMSEWLQSGRPGCTQEFAFSKSFWDMAKDDPEFNSMINDIMAGDSRLVMRAVVDKCGEVFKGVSSLVDVGGGTGTAARAIAQAFPGLKRVVVFDLPHVIAAAPKSPLVEAIGGNMFESVPKADAIFFKAVLHDWSDEKCVKILKKCREAIPEKGGKVIIIDIVVKDRKDYKEIETQLLWDIGMMIGADGKEREEHEWSKIFMEAGFTHYKIAPLGLRSLIEVFP